MKKINWILLIGGIISMFAMASMLPSCASNARTENQETAAALVAAYKADAAYVATKATGESITYDNHATVVRIRDCDYIKSLQVYGKGGVTGGEGYTYVHAADCRNSHHNPRYTDYDDEGDYTEYPEEWQALSVNQRRPDTLLGYRDPQTGVAHISYTGKHR